jgi:Domain of unknown function (DUF397)
MEMNGFALGDDEGVQIEHTGDEVIVRNGEAPYRELRFTLDEWAAFIDGVKRGEFDPAPES